MIIPQKKSGSIRPRNDAGAISGRSFAKAITTVVLAVFAILTIGPIRAGYATTARQPGDALLDIAAVLQLAGQQSETAVLARTQVGSA
jgi:hypothetical protein